MVFVLIIIRLIGPFRRVQFRGQQLWLDPGKALEARANRTELENARNSHALWSSRLW